MNKAYRVLGILIFLGVGQALPVVAQGPYEKYLPARDVEKATGLRGIRLIARGSAAGAGGDLNFADDAGELVLMVQFADSKSFAGFKTQYGKTAVGGVGDQAIQGGSMPGMPDNVLAFTRGSRCVVLTSFGDFVTKKLYLTIDQLTSLARIIAARL